MTISELITALQHVQEMHGDLPVLHHDDWCDVVVDTLRFEPVCEVVENKQPAHVVLTGGFNDLTIDYKTGTFV